MKREWFTKGILIGAGITAGIVGSLALAVTVGTVKTWTTGETLTAADLNATITSLKTALEAIPNWTKNGTSAVYTDGNVGIGTDSPGAKLDIGAIALTLNQSGGIQLSTTDANKTWKSSWTMKSSDSGVPSVEISGVEDLNAWLVFRNGSPLASRLGIGPTGNVVIGTGTLTVAGTGNSSIAGNVGIGTTTPGNRLWINGGDETVTINSDGGSPQIYFRNTIDANPGIINSNLDLQLTAGSALGVYIKSGGNVGIGTATPDALLDVISGGANGTAHGAWGSHSSRTIKKDIEYLDTEDQQEMLEKFLKTPLARFRYKNEPKSARPHLGLIAEESPQEVLQEGHDAVMLMDYVTFLAASVKAQQEQIEKLKAKIESLESLSK